MLVYVIDKFPFPNLPCVAKDQVSLRLQVVPRTTVQEEFPVPTMKD